MVSLNKRGVRRVSPSLYKLYLASHIIVSVGWLGTAYTKFFLELAAIMAESADVSKALLVAIEKLHVAFPIMAIATIVTGVLLSLGTKWGILKHYWVAVKLVLTIGVISTAIQLDDRFVRQSISSLSGQKMTPMIPLICLTAAHMLMLGAATVISVYKPWGKTWFGRRFKGEEVH